MKNRELVPNQAETAVDSMVYNTVDGEHLTFLFPGTAIYKNKLGGTIFTFSGTPRTRYILTEAFSYLNYSRKQQLTRMDGYVAMTKKICEKWGVPYLDLYSNNELLASLKSETTEFLYDGVHLSSAGYELVTPYIEDFIKKVASLFWS